MMGRTVYVGNPYYLSLKYNQLVLSGEDGESQVPIEDITTLIIDDPQVQISAPCIVFLTQNNVAIVWCDNKHMPESMTLSINAHHIQNKVHRAQLSSSKPKQKVAWKMVVKAKILNQAYLLDEMGLNNSPLVRWSKKVRSGDPDNYEGRAAKYYWQHLFFDQLEFFKRDRFGEPPNNALNYGYAILRAHVARALIGSGLWLSMGIHHANKYNAYCLADDMMEPFRPWVDLAVMEMLYEDDIPKDLLLTHRKRLMQFIYSDGYMRNKQQPLIVSIQESAWSLARYFQDKRKTLKFPILRNIL